MPSKIKIGAGPLPNMVTSYGGVDGSWKAQESAVPELHEAAYGAADEQEKAFALWGGAEQRTVLMWLRILLVVHVAYILASPDPRLLPFLAPALAAALVPRSLPVQLVVAALSAAASKLLGVPGEAQGNLLPIFFTSTASLVLLLSAGTGGQWTLFQKLLNTEEKRLRLASQVKTVFKFLNSQYDAICFCDEEGVISINSYGMDSFFSAGDEGQMKPGSLIGRSVLEAVVSPQDKARFRQFLKGACESEALSRITLTMRRSFDNARTSEAREVDIGAMATPEESKSKLHTHRLALFISEKSSENEVADKADEVSTAEIGQAFRMKAPFSKLPSSISEGCIETDDADEDQDTRTTVSRDVGRGRPSGRAGSCFSAPPVMMHPKVMEFVRNAETADCDGTEEGDCLPPDALVWVEGAPAPTMLSKIEAGMKVLCFDHLARGMKYAEVTDIKTFDAMESDWVTVTLEDGTELQMTSDHPVFPEVVEQGVSRKRSGSTSETAVHAGSLEVGRHSLEVLKMVPVTVQKVEHSVREAGADSKQPPSTRVAMSVSQADRHSVFVSAGGPNASVGMAVASASISVDQLASARPNTTVKNTFLELVEDDDDGSSTVVVASRRRRNRFESCPAGMAYDDSFAEDTKPIKIPRGPSMASMASSWASSAQSSLGSSGTGLVIGCQAKERGVAFGRTSNDDSKEETVRLSAALAAKRQGLSSIGSLKHNFGSCYPCLMQTWYHSGKTDQQCKFGTFCGRCHEPHSVAQLKKMRRAAKPQKARS